MDETSDDLEDLLEEVEEPNEIENSEIEDFGTEDERCSGTHFSVSDEECDTDDSENNTSTQHNTSQKLKEVKVPNPNLPCLLCGQHGLEEGRLGVLYKFGTVVAHHFCLMLSSGLQQVGDDSDGILGFLVHDIKREIKRGKSLRCHLCNATNATVGCAVDSCLKTFHLPCLLRSGGLSLFFGAFDSFCQEHRPSQQVPKICWAPPGKGTGPRYSQCGVCLEKVPLQPGGELSIWTPCCKAWFHRNCVARLASAAGSHHAKCPLCNSREAFQQEMLRCGIYIPDKDAEWELEEGAFQDLYTRHSTCDAPSCTCPHGRGHQEAETEWELVLCELCAAQGVHSACANLDDSNPRWKCSICVGALKPDEQEQLDARLRKADWVEESDSEVEEEEEEEEEEGEKTESEEEEELKKTDAAVFEKCFASSDDRVWKAVTTSWRVNMPRLNLEDLKLAERMGLDHIQNREEVVALIKERASLTVKGDHSIDEEEDEEDLFKCDLCSFKCQGEAGLSRHGRLHDPGRPYACDQCGLRFLKQGHVTIHAKLHSGDRPHRCDQCSADFGEAWRLQLHMAKHDTRRKYECSQCSQRFKTRLSLRAHTKKQHLTEDTSRSFAVSSSGSFSNTSLPNLAQSDIQSQTYRPDVATKDTQSIDDLLLKPFKLKLKRSARTWQDEDNTQTSKKTRIRQDFTSSDESSDSDSEVPSTMLQNQSNPFAKRGPRQKIAAKNFMCHSCDFKSLHKANLTRHLESCHKSRETSTNRSLKETASFSEEDHYDIPDDNPYDADDDLDKESNIDRPRLQLEIRSPVDLIIDKLPSPGWSSEDASSSISPTVNKKKKISLEKKNKDMRSPPLRPGQKKSDAGKDKKRKKVKKLQKEYWVVVEGIRNPVRVVEDVEDKESSSEDEPTSSHVELSCAVKQDIPERDEERMKCCRVNIERITLSKEQQVYALSVIDSSRRKKVIGNSTPSLIGRPEVGSDLVNRVEVKTELVEAVMYTSGDPPDIQELSEEDKESSVKDEETECDCVFSKNENHIEAENLESDTIDTEQEECGENRYRKITSNLGFFMLSEDTEKKVSEDDKDQSLISQNLQVDHLPATKEKNTTRASSERESKHAAISNLCEVRLEILKLTNEEKDYMKSLLRRGLGLSTSVNHMQTGGSVTETNERKISSVWDNGLAHKESSSTIILERASICEENSLVISPILEETPSERPKASCDLPKLQLEPHDLPDLDICGEDTLVNDLLESDSEDEGKVDNVDILLKPEELLTTRSLKPETKKTMRRNLDDPELQNLFLELESLQSSP